MRQTYREMSRAVLYRLVADNRFKGTANAVLGAPQVLLLRPLAGLGIGIGMMTAIHDFMRRLQDIQTLPQVALRLCQLTASPDSSMQEIEALLRLDPVLAARLLHLVNSAYYGLRYPVHDLNKAVSVLGTKALRNLVLIDAMKGAFFRPCPGSPLDPAQLWLHSAAMGVGAKLLSRRLLGHPGEDAFVAGLLHDIGLLVEAQVAPDDVAQVVKMAHETPLALVDIEHQVLGTDHTAVGSVLVATWGLPASVTHAIAQHHTPLADETPLDQPAAFLHLAHALAAEAGYSNGIELEEGPSACVAAYIDRHVDEFQVLLEDFVHEMHAAACLYQGEGP